MNDSFSIESAVDTASRIPREERDATLLQHLQWNTKRFMLSHTKDLGFIQARDYEAILDSEIRLGQETKADETLLVGLTPRQVMKDDSGKTLECYENPATVVVKGEEKKIWIAFDIDGNVHKIYNEPQQKQISRRRFLRMAAAAGEATVLLTVANEVTKIPDTIRQLGDLVDHMTTSKERDALPEMNKVIHYTDAYGTRVSADGETIITIPKQAADSILNTINAGGSQHPVDFPLEWFDGNGHKKGETVLSLVPDKNAIETNALELGLTLTIGDKFAVYAKSDSANGPISSTVLFPDGRKTTLNDRYRPLPGTDNVYRTVDDPKGLNPDGDKLLIGDVRIDGVLEYSLLPAEDGFRRWYSPRNDNTIVVMTQNADRSVNPKQIITLDIHSLTGEKLYETPEPLAELYNSVYDPNHNMALFVNDSQKNNPSIIFYNPEKSYEEAREVRVLPDSTEVDERGYYTKLNVFGDTIVAFSLKNFDPTVTDNGIQVSTFDFEGNRKTSQFIQLPEKFSPPILLGGLQWAVHEHYITLYNNTGDLIHLPYQ